jgi:hypothetical protein
VQARAASRRRAILATAPAGVHRAPRRDGETGLARAPRGLALLFARTASTLRA